MQTQQVPYQPGMNLGRTYDMKTFSPGLDVFTDGSMKSVKEIARHQNTINYSVIKKAQDVNNVLNISGEISLRVKAGLCSVEGTGNYLTDIGTEDNTLEILAMAHVETVTETMTETKMKPGLKKAQIGTHFIRSITYGGNLIVRIRIKNSDNKTLKEVSAKLSAGAQSGVVDAGAKAKFKQLEHDISSSSEIDIKYYSSTPTSFMPRDIEGMLKVLDDFKDDVMRQNDGKGCPCTCELVPLNVLDVRVPNLQKEKALEVHLTQLEGNYDDLLAAKAKLQTFLEGEDLELTDEQEKEFCKMERRIDEVLKCFNTAIGNLDLTATGKGMEQINHAFKVYSDNKILAGGYRREIAKYIKSVGNKQAVSTPMRDLPTGGALDLILLGKTGRGTSATGNTIFGQKKFTSQIKGTVRQHASKMSEVVGGRKISILDIQGAVDAAQTENMMEYLQSAIERTFPQGIHACLFILSATDVLSKEEISALDSLRHHMGDILEKHIICIFTRGDTFDQQMSLDGRSLTFAEYIESHGGPLRKILEDCKNRYMLINNIEPDSGKKREMVIKLVEMIDRMIEENGSKRLTFS